MKWSSGSLSLAQELDIATHRNQADSVIRLLSLEADEPLPVAKGKRLHPDAHQFGHKEMAEFVDKDEDAKDDYKSQDGTKDCSHFKTFA
jgi:hypothetical protein